VRTHQSNSALAEVPLGAAYESDVHDLVHEFHLSCLERSTIYRRAVGDFASRGLSIAAQGITALIERGGRVLLVTSPLFPSTRKAREGRGKGRVASQ
jgi:hypothetical protein